MQGRWKSRSGGCLLVAELGSPMIWGMIQLSPDECRVLGVLVEKAYTTPGQYPLSLNAVMVGSNQKSNRDPVVEYSEDRCETALTTLRQKGLVVLSDQAGGRVYKYRHQARDVLKVDGYELALLTELLLRGPQTAGELRTRASRMTSFETLDGVQTLLNGLIEREEPLVRRLAPAPGSRAERYVQLLCPNLHPLDAPAAVESSRTAADEAADGALVARVATLEAEVQRLRAAITKLAGAVGEADPLG